jgi:chromosome condensin MukBEF MukE localization factor
MVIYAGLTYLTYRLARENLRFRRELNEARLAIVHERERAAGLKADNERLSRQVRSQLVDLRRLRAERAVSETRASPSARTQSTRAGFVGPA